MHVFKYALIDEGKFLHVLSQTVPLFIINLIPLIKRMEYVRNSSVSQIKPSEDRVTR